MLNITTTTWVEKGRGLKGYKNIWTV